MTEIKICGITNLEDALTAAELGVDALGFIFYEKSPRYIGPLEAKIVIEALAEKARRTNKGRPAAVGVFVNHEISAIRSIMELCGLDMIQLHGDESAGYCLQFPSSRLIKAFSPAMAADANLLCDFPARAIILDARDADRYGGTGKRADWGLAKIIKESRPLILAGGLNEGNIREAILTVSPQAVDINSGIESAPGRKDARMLRNTVEIAKTVVNVQNEISAKIFIKDEEV